MEEFQKRMSARKLKEANDQAEKQKEMGVVAFPVVFHMNILGTSMENAKETFEILGKILREFEDLSDVKGEFDG